MRAMMMMTAAILLACVAYSHQENSIEKSGEIQDSARQAGEAAARKAESPDVSVELGERAAAANQDSSDLLDDDNRRRRKHYHKQRKHHRRPKKYKHHKHQKRPRPSSHRPFNLDLNFSPNVDVSNSYYPGSPAAPEPPVAPAVVDATTAPENLIASRMDDSQESSGENRSRLHRYPKTKISKSNLLKNIEKKVHELESPHG